MQLNEQGGAATPPLHYDQDAELSVLGSALLMPKLLPELSLALKPSDFYLPSHQHVWQAILDLDGQGLIPDPILLTDALEKSNKLEDAGGHSFVSSLPSMVSSAVQAPHHAKLIKKHSVTRRLGKLIDDVNRARGKEDPASILSGLQDALSRLETDSTKDVPELDSLLHNHWEHLNEIAASGQHIAGQSTGFVNLDRLISGLMPANLIIVASRPAMGKTAFSLQVLKTIAEARHPVLMFSLEMAESELTTRLISLHSRLPGQALLNAQLSVNQWDMALKAHQELAGLPLYIDDTPGITFAELRAKARRLHRRKPLGLIVVDYLQLMSSERYRDSREQEVAEVSKGLKGLAKELNIPVMALAQLNRSCETRVDKRPLLSDLRESGGIEQDADLALMLYRDDYYNADSPTGEAEVICRKNRHGPTGTIRLAFQQECGRFATMGIPQERSHYVDTD